MKATSVLLVPLVMGLAGAAALAADVEADYPCTAGDSVPQTIGSLVADESPDAGSPPGSEPQIGDFDFPWYA